MYEDKPPIEEVLEHHGIKGQKWGVRRFQNEDGSLTSAGAKRYGDNDQTKAIAKEPDNINRWKYARASKERDKQLSYAKRMTKAWESDIERNTEHYETLKKEGEKGSRMRGMYGDIIDNDSTFESVHGQSLKSCFKEELAYAKEDMQTSISAAKSWASYQDKLMKMDISQASKKDVAKQAKKLLAEAINEGVENDDDNDEED